jgi:hypothetical protein
MTTTARSGYETARAQYGDGTLEAQEWAEATLTRLCPNDVLPQCRPLYAT